MKLYGMDLDLPEILLDEQNEAKIVADRLHDFVKCI